MKPCIAIFLLLVAAMIRSPAQAEEPQSVWILLMGGNAERCWWTVKKLRSFPAEEKGLYQGAATLNRVLLGTFGGCSIAVDEETIQLNPQGSLDVTAGQNMQTTVELLVRKLFKGRHPRLALELSLLDSGLNREAFRPGSRLSGFETFVDGLEIVKVISRPPNHRLLSKLVKQMVVNRQEIIGGKRSEIYAPQERDTKALARVLETTIKEQVAGVEVSYSQSLDTFFFSMPSISDQAFVDTCWGILSNSHW